MSEWIPITERLPIDGQDVLIIERWNDTPIVACRNSRGDWFSDKSHIEINGDASLSDCIDGVTHWMPLPALPEGRSND